MFLKNKTIILKIRRSQVTDYAALNFNMDDGRNSHYFGKPDILQHSL